MKYSWNKKDKRIIIEAETKFDTYKLGAICGNTGVPHTIITNNHNDQFLFEVKPELLIGCILKEIL